MGNEEQQGVCMSTSKSKGPVLRSLGGGAVRIVTTKQDWETRRVGEGPESGLAVGQSLIAFEAESFREFQPDTDLWDFLVVEGRTKFHAYLSGEDIFMVYVASALS
jgi:hypothetical protein